MRATCIEVPDYDEVYRLEDPDGFLALHRTRPGPAFGGTRLRDYPSSDDALADALRLAKAMTRKYAINELPFGGGKAVLVGGSIRDRHAAFAELGDFVESLGGRFITGSDLGVTTEDVRVMQERTRHIEAEDGSEAASQSVLWAMKGALRVHYGDDDLGGLTVVIQGLGALGSRLTAKCVREGACVVGSDIDPSRVEQAARELAVRTVVPEEILQTAGEVLAPCAVGGVVHRGLIAALRCPILCGGANNILDEDATAQALHEAGIIYVPDFLSNSGAAIEGAWTRLRGPGDYSHEIQTVRDCVIELLRRARQRGCPPLQVALEDVRSRIP